MLDRTIPAFFLKKMVQNENSGNLPTMSNLPTRQEPGSLAPVEPLTSKTADGEPYERSASVQAEISRTLAIHPPEWLRQAPDLQNETLVHLIRQSRDRDSDLMGHLMQVLSKRIHRLARSRLRGFDKMTAEALVLKVEIDILELVLARKPSLSTEFLEVAFAEAVIVRTLRALRAHRRSPHGHLGEMLPGATDEDGDEIERPIELAPDNRPGPEAVLLQAREETARADLAEKARKAVKDSQHFEAVMLHFGDGKPIRSSDPNELDLVQHLQISEGQVRYRLRAGMKAIRKALGVQNDEK
ncbi:MAG: hypothetical protein DMG16_07555 [Acidobacteria bacterium]|nr:MAG: hypothetical protein DMG16_07555 [Acidobacteriota bacterium]